MAARQTSNTTCMPASSSGPEQVDHARQHIHMQKDRGAKAADTITGFVGKSRSLLLDMI